jgi:hypothetical protein
MAKKNDTPKDLPVLMPTGKRPSLKELADTAKIDPVVDRLITDKNISVSAFNSSI